jgi:hypothetical protein
MESTLEVLNDLVDGGIVERYAIGGAVAAIFWAEPFDTIDLDVFVLLPETAHPLDPLRDVIGALQARGYSFEGDLLVIEGIPVQFIPAEDATGLRKEALEQATEHLYLGSVPTWVIRPEYLVALALDAHRPKDYERVYRLLQEAEADRTVIGSLIDRYQLQPYWDTFSRRYPEALPGQMP